jgi:hypothetical protein
LLGCRPLKILGADGFDAKALEPLWSGVADVKLKVGAGAAPPPNMGLFCSAGAGVEGPWPPNWKLNDPEGVGVADPPKDCVDGPFVPAKGFEPPLPPAPNVKELPPAGAAAPPPKVKALFPAEEPLTPASDCPNVKEDVAFWLALGALFWAPKVNEALPAGGAGLGAGDPNMLDPEGIAGWLCWLAEPCL